MLKIITSPGSYIQGNGEIKHLADHYKGVGANGAYIIVDKFTANFINFNSLIKVYVNQQYNYTQDLNF